MATDSDLLFVYGTLRPAFTNSFSHYLRQHGRYVGEGTFPGQLLDLGNYPGALYQPESKTAVQGTIYNINSGKQHVLTYLDDYEGIGESFAQPQEYIRTVIDVNYNGTTSACWIYLYNLFVSGKRVILSGDYVAYMGK